MIPKILFRTVPKQTSSEVEQWWRDACSLHPDWQHITYRDPLDPKDWPLTSPYWGMCLSGAQLSGLLRLEGLVKHGGIYIDSDFEVVRPFDPLLGCKVLAGWEDPRSIPDAMMGSEAGSPVIRECLNRAIAKMKELHKPDMTKEHYALETGPRAFHHVIRRSPDALVLPPGCFFPYHWKQADNPPTKENIAKAYPWCFAIHRWAASWRGNKPNLKPDMTFVVPCKGRLSHLKQTLPTVLNQHGDFAFEIIVVDYNDPEKCGEWAESLNDQRIRVKRVPMAPADRYNMSHARNIGCRRARGKYVCVLDADQVLAPDYGYWAFRQMEDNPLVRVIFRQIPKEDEKTEVDQEIVRSWGMKELPLVNQGGGLPQVFRKEDWEKTRGYDETMKGWGYEEIDLWIRLRMLGGGNDLTKYRIITHNERTAHIHHGDEHRTTFFAEKNKWKSGRSNELMAEGNWNRKVNEHGAGKLEVTPKMMELLY